MRQILAVLAVSAALISPARAQAPAGEIALVCSFLEEWCRLMATSFERDTGIRVAMLRRSTGEAYAQIKAEAARPRIDVWWGGTGDPHVQAAADGLTEAYRSPRLAELRPWAREQAEATGYRAYGVIAGALAVAYNAPALRAKNIAPPRCWADLADPRFKGLIQSNDPTASGTGYAYLATVVTLMGEDGAFAYLKQVHANVNSYARSGSIPARSVATGESPVGITFLDNALFQMAQGARDMVPLAPCEGTSFEIGSMSIVKGARNMEGAKRFHDWALSAPAQALGVKAGLSFSIPSNMNAALPEGLPDPATIKTVDYDHARFGDPQTRARLLRRFDTEIRGNAP